MKCFIPLIVLYRPPSSNVSLFFDEFASYLAHILTASGHLLIVGDFSFHVDSQNNTGRRFIGLLHSFNLRQHVNLRIRMAILLTSLSLERNNPSSRIS